MGRRGRPPVTPMTDTGRIIREARMQRGWTQAELAAQIGCSTPAVAGWESGRRLRVDPVYALSMSRVMPELNYMDLVQKSKRSSERPKKRKLDLVRESQVPLPRGLLTTVRSGFTRDQDRTKTDDALRMFFDGAPVWVDEVGCAHLADYFEETIRREEMRDPPRPDVIAFLREEYAAKIATLSPDEETMELLNQGEFEQVCARLREQVRHIYQDLLPKYRWILAHALLASGDCDCAFAHLRRASGSFTPRVRTLLDSMRGPRAKE